MRYRFPACVVDVDDDARWVVTRFDDGTEVHAHPNHDPESVARAAALGYHDTWAMSRDHELAHHWLAFRAEHWASFTMWSLAHPDLHRDDATIHQEEANVLRFQRGLDKAAVRPWEALREP